MKPELIIIAGPNGAGKTSNAKKILSDKGIDCFHYDEVKGEIYKTLIPSDISDTMAHNSAMKRFNDEKEKALKSLSSFCFETNFNATSCMDTPEEFLKQGYNLVIHYLTLPTIAVAKRRVQFRVLSGGHNVPINEIEERYSEGLKNLFSHYQKFDQCFIYKSSQIKDKNIVIDPTVSLYFEKGILKEQASEIGYISNLCKPMLNPLDKKRGKGFSK